MLHSAAIPSSCIMREELEGSVESLEMVSPMHRRITGSGSEDRLCAACTLLRDTISTRHDFEAERFWRMTAHTRRVLVSDPFDSVPRTDITPRMLHTQHSIGQFRILYHTTVIGDGS